MIPLYSIKQNREVDDYAINHLKIPGIVLMENAALEIFNIIKNKIADKKLGYNLGFVCGKGNNGGDGFATARHFANANFNVYIVHFGNENELSDDCKTNFNILKNQAGDNKNIQLKKYSSIKDLKLLNNCDVVFDAMLGSGVKDDLKEPYKSIVNYLNQLKKYMVAIDIPTGLNADNGFTNLCFNADVTVTLGEFKKGLFFQDGNSFAGEIIKGNIGVSNSFYDKYEIEDYLIEPEDANNSFPQKSKSLNKYSAGKVLVIAGSKNLPGAAILASSSALKSGAGASILCYPDSATNLIQNNLDEVIVKSYDDNSKGFLSVENLSEINERLKWADVLALGPGLGRNENTIKAVIQIIKNKIPNNIVIDADAIFALSKIDYKNLNLKNLILTPHHGEFSNLIGVDVQTLQTDLLKYGKQFAIQTGAYLALKGSPTIVFNPSGEALINTTGNSGMAKFGTGDVLTGIIAGFLSQNKNEIEKSLIAAVYSHSLSADLLLNTHTEFGFTATDIINNLPAAINFIRSSVV